MLIVRLFQSLFDVGDEVFLVFETARHTDETGGDSGCFKLSVSHLTVRGGCGIEAASTRIGYVCLDGGKAEFFHKRLRSGTTALDYKRNHAAAAVGQVFLREGVVFVVFQA